MARFDDFNHSELIQIALNNDIRGACRATPRSAIIQHLETFEDIETRNPLIEMRDSMSEFLMEAWEDNLDIQKPPGRPCPECALCTDLQIVACYTANKDQLSLWPNPKHA